MHTRTIIHAFLYIHTYIHIYFKSPADERYVSDGLLLNLEYIDTYIYIQTRIYIGIHLCVYIQKNSLLDERYAGDGLLPKLDAHPHHMLRLRCGQFQTCDEDKKHLSNSLSLFHTHSLCIYVHTHTCTYIYIY